MEAKNTDADFLLTNISPKHKNKKMFVYYFLRYCIVVLNCEEKTRRRISRAWAPVRAKVGSSVKYSFVSS